MLQLEQLLGLARHCRYAWARPRVQCMPVLSFSRAIAPVRWPAALLPPHTPAAAGVGSVRFLQRSTLAQQRHLATAAVRRGNVFLDGSTAGRQRPQEEGYAEPQCATPLYDSSMFNYDSEDEDEAQQQQPQNSSDDTGGSAAAAAAAAAAQQQRRRRPGGSSGQPQQQQQQEEGQQGAGRGQVEVVLPPPRATKVKNAEFVKSSVSVAQCPPAVYPEFAVIGRSNVGKSSLINMVTGRNSLAMVSKTPGKTRCINHFLINGAWYLVDLPGYGYARVSKGSVVEWNKFTREYFLERETLVTVLLLVDASIPPMPLDISCAAWFAEAEIPFTIVFTKLDKRKKGAPPAEENIAAFEAQVEEACGYRPPAILTSSKTGKGRGEVLAHVAQLRDFFNKTQHGL